MIRRLLSKLGLGLKVKPTVVPAARYGISPAGVSAGATQVVERLQRAGFEAYVVGGAVRDLLLGSKPKDFDIATNATPEQVKPLFRRAFIIGRRFRLVHVLVGPETIEVSTFRAPQEENEVKADEHGRILSDNVFGSQADDAVRRDFTVNALYYDPVADQIRDYLGSLKDVKARQLRLIGDPETRYREDPVRMLRAVRLSAKLQLGIATRSRTPIRKLAPLLSNVPASRLFDEMQKLLLSGHAVATLTALRREGLHHGLLPLLDVILEQPMGQKFIELALGDTDQRVQADKPVSPAFLFATLLWHEVLQAWEGKKNAGEKAIPALHDAMDEVLDRQSEQIAIPKRFAGIIKDIWALQPRFEQRSGQRPFRLLELERFRAGLDFLVLRCRSGELPEELGDWWLAFVDADGTRRADMLQPEERGTGTKRRRSRRRRKPQGGGEVAGGDDAGDDSAGGDDAHGEDDAHDRGLGGNDNAGDAGNSRTSGPGSPATPGTR